MHLAERGHDCADAVFTPKRHVLCHTPAALSAVFDEPSLIACAGLVPSVALADRIGLRGLADKWLTVPGSRGTAGAKVMSLVAGMLAGADSIDDLDLLRHGGMDRVFTGMRARSTLGVFLRGFTFGHVRQLDAVAARALIGLAEVVPGIVARPDEVTMLDVDDTVKPVFGAAKQGAEHGYTQVKVSACDLMCRCGYDLMCRSVFGES